MRDNLLRKLVRASPRERALAIEAAGALIVASVAIRLRPFRDIVERPVSPKPGSGQVDAAAIGLAVERASRRLPWRTVCFHEALAAQAMLRRRGMASTLHYGLSNGDELRAHVWVVADRRVVVGGRDMPGFHCVATFPG